MSAWQAGPSGRAQLDPIVAEGIAACERLDPPDFAAPGNCLSIRMAPIRARSDRVEAELRVKSQDPAVVIQRFDALERDFQSASAIGQRFSTSRVDPMQLQAVGSDLKRISCLARADLDLLKSVPKALASRLAALQAGLDPELQAAACP